MVLIMSLLIQKEQKQILDTVLQHEVSEYSEIISFLERIKHFHIPLEIQSNHITLSLFDLRSDSLANK